MSFTPLSVWSQEVTHQVIVPTESLRIITSMGLEPDHGSSAEELLLYVTDEQLKELRKREVSLQLVRQPRTDSHLRMIDRSDWNALQTDQLVPHRSYPTYELYEQLMTELPKQFPDICQLQEIGCLPSGRRILALKITDIPDCEEAEPKFLYTSTMHGDELAGYPLMLMLIEELLLGYETDAAIKDLVDHTEIWINPLANPDGAYAGGNHQVNDATRRNSNGVDLNRNFPDPDDGDHPDGHDHQQETIHFMQLHENVSFDMSCNLHSGAEVFNYPWDTYNQVHPDDAWWRLIGRQFADQLQSGDYKPRYFRQLDNGITNGYEWYPITGGRQDYVTYFHHGREATLEIEGRKDFPANRLPELWETTRLGFLSLLTQAGYGLRGIVTDAQTGEPISARIRIPGYDRLHSEVYSKLPTGRYHRYLKAGRYTFEFSAPGYLSQEVEARIKDGEASWLNVELVPSGQTR
ncbi:MAG: M14 family zinc carboxypeptidase [Bacteroidota bacterium]